MPWKRAVAAASLTEGDAVRTRIDGVDLAVVRVGDSVFGISDICTHQFAHLSDGYVDADESSIECPLHQARFELGTGRLIAGPRCPALRVFPVKIESGWCYIDCN